MMYKLNKKAPLNTDSSKTYHYDKEVVYTYII